MKQEHEERQDGEEGIKEAKKKVAKEWRRREAGYERMEGGENVGGEAVGEENNEVEEDLCF